MSQPVSPRNTNGHIPPITPSFVDNSNPEVIDNQSEVIEDVNSTHLDKSTNKSNNLLKKFNALDERTKGEALELGAKIIQIQSETLNRIGEQTKEIRADLNSIGQTLRSLDAPGGPLDPVRLKEEDEEIQRDEGRIEQQKKDLEQQRKDLEEQKKELEEFKKARQARWDSFKYIVGLGWVRDGAQLAKDVAYDNRETILRIGLVAGAIFFLRLVTDNYQTILQYKTILIPSTCFGVTALTRYPMLIKERILTYSKPNYKE